MIEYRDNMDDLAADDLRGFFVGWPNPPNPATHIHLLKGSDAFVLAVDNDIGNVVGFITAITDGVLAAYIPLLEVLPEYRSSGIGQELVRRMVEKLRHLYMIDLLCDEKLQPYYERFGFDRAQGMLMRNYDRQSGGNTNAG